MIDVARPRGESERNGPATGVESVRRALRILRCFTVEVPEWGVSDLTRQLGMHKSTVYRSLATMESEGFVHHSADGRYALGWRLFELGGALRGWPSIRKVVLRRLEELVAATSETAHLAVFDEGSVLYVEKVESSRPLRMPSAVGKRVPAHCTALGKVFLAGLAQHELLPLIYRPLAAITPRTIVDSDDLRKAVESVRERGYAVDDEEIEEGLMCVAAPIVDDQDGVAAAISIAGPTSRLGPRLEQHVDSVRATARALSLELGAAARGLRELASPPLP